MRSPDRQDACVSCKNVAPAVDIVDVMGAGKAAHMFCMECLFQKRSKTLTDVQLQQEKKARIDRETSTPQ